jgi:3-hydroxyisobutyrate dehydrogenase
MGGPMASRLVGAGLDVKVWNRSAAPTVPLAEAGAQVAATAAEAVAGRDLVITMLSDPAAVRAVFFGAGGAATRLAPGSLVAEMSTIGPDAVRELRSELPAAVRLVDAPVLGSVPQATAGQLRIFLGGTAEDVEACQEPMSVLGTPRHVGPLGTAAALKLVLNASTISLFVMVGEILALADGLGLDHTEAMEGLAATGIAPFLTRIGDRINDHEVPTYFGLGLARKDLDLALAAAGGDARPAKRLLSAGRDQLDAATRAGLSERDVSTVIHLLRGQVDHP